ncbi:ribose-phosphate pyrophosphokinase [Acinetobacter phage Acj9]|uniref:Putative phosphoribosylpyrophosphate synthetase n=1 Tax=Acinetobacter phage Acj9 TaxID=760939 RepID=E5EPK5_9CAUD|nr:ribose-phosphate pyrophosphokinase [Acinetobacter phage Acj9]ADG59971.1 putative phosphoribosylpyrophosphate synthetase [Acinetobacter phage Acj9]
MKNMIDKFVLTVLDTQVSVRNYKPDVLNFNDGSVRVTLPYIDDCASVKQPYGLTISAFVESMDDLMVVAQMKEIADRKFGHTKISLNLLGTSYTRYDRVMFEDESDAFGAKVYASFINALEFSEVRFYDCHSDVMLSLVRNSFNVAQNITSALTVFYLADHSLVCPDKGASKKMERIDVLCDKVRVPETGKIKGVEVVKFGDDIKGDLLVLDDICEGGGTFLGVADAIKSEPKLADKSISLYITHGIFSNNAIPKLLEKYSKIYVYFMKESVYNALTEQQKQFVVPMNLIKA